MPSHPAAPPKAPVWTALVLAGLCGLLSQTANATIVTYVTPSGSTEKHGNPVNAQADITVGSGTVGVIFHNLQTFTAQDNQNINGAVITFANASNLSNPVLTSSSGTDITIDSTGTVTSSTSANPQWLVSLSGLTLTLTTIGRSQAPETIIGPPDVGTGGVGSQYTNAKSSIVNGTHDPFLLDTGSFNVAITNLNTTATIASVVFTFSTGAADSVTGVPQTPASPEPSSLALSAIGLAALGIIRASARRRLQRKPQPAIAD